MCVFLRKREREGEWKVNTTTDREVNFNRFFLRKNGKKWEIEIAEVGELSLKERQIDLEFLGLLCTENELRNRQKRERERERERERHRDREAQRQRGTETETGRQTDGH